MANTYTQIYVHFIFAVLHREQMIDASFREELHKYITGIVSKKGNKLIAINSMPEHIHIFLGLNPAISISDLVRDVKYSSSKFLNQKESVHNKFQWQEGFGAFTYGHSQINNVVRYILNQEEHHRKKTFREEYLKMLELFHINYKDEYLFKWIGEGANDKTDA